MTRGRSRVYWCTTDTFEAWAIAGEGFRMYAIRRMTNNKKLCFEKRIFLCFILFLFREGWIPGKLMVFAAFGD